MKYIEYFPQVLKEIYEIKLLAKAIDPLLQEQRHSAEDLRNQFFLSTMTEFGLAIWEKALGIEVNSQNIEVRRFNVRSKLLGNNSSLRVKLNTLLGEDKWRMTIDSQNCHAIFNLELTTKELQASVIELLENTLPMNLTYEINFAFNKHNDLKAYTHQQLQAYKHEEISSKNL